MWVFREGRTTVGGKVVLDGLASSLKRAIAFFDRSPDSLVDTLLRTGELECALADQASPDAPCAAELTNIAAAALLELPGSDIALQKAPALLSTIAPPAFLTVSPPEGFAYYALHPLDFANLATSAPLKSAQAAVVGIRSIGTTLGAVVMAALRRRGVRAERVTVRPTGHPYDRRTTFSSEQLRWIARRRAACSNFLVVDEGPGISGSSFLSVGDALLEAGVERERITFLGSRYPDVDALSANFWVVRCGWLRLIFSCSRSCSRSVRGLLLGGG